MANADHIHRVCLIEDDEIMGESLAQLLRLEGYEVDWLRTATDGRAALDAHRYSIVVSDIRLPDRDGGELYLELRDRHANLPPFLFMTAYGTIDRAVELLKAGAADYVTKPFDAAVLVAKVRQLADAYGVADAGASEDLGVSPAMRRIAEAIPRYARNASALLVTGDSGVGKEHVARLFHRHVVPSGGDFVPVNCASIPESLMEAELFGYEKGAFTGAVKAKRGYIELADRGVLFLDEIGEMPLSMQAKLLRVLQDRQFFRLGAEKPVSSSFRLVCATHRDLKALVEQGSFREDLYYRINVIHLRIPPLRERGDDIRWFLRHFVEAFNHDHPDEPRRIDPRTEQALLAYPWPGNIRELKHAVERACIVSNGPVLDAEAFFGEGAQSAVTAPEEATSLADYLMACEREYLIRTLERFDGHMTHTAESLGITRKTLWEKCRRLGVRTRSDA